jgi:hypothetical protein
MENFTHLKGLPPSPLNEAALLNKQAWHTPFLFLKLVISATILFCPHAAEHNKNEIIRLVNLTSAKIN